MNKYDDPSVFSAPRLDVRCVGAILGALLVATGCASIELPGPMPEGPRMHPRYAASLYERAAQALSCPQTELQLEYAESLEEGLYVYRATGCGQQQESLLWCTWRCVWSDTPRARASFDLQCPPSEISRTYLGDATFGMAGCGRTMTYMFINGRLVANAATERHSGTPRRSGAMEAGSAGGAEPESNTGDGTM